jgi:hypothetical protein
LSLFDCFGFVVVTCGLDFAVLERLDCCVVVVLATSEGWDSQYNSRKRKRKRRQVTVRWLRAFSPKVCLLPLAIDYRLFARLMLALHRLMLDGGSDLLFDLDVFCACGGGGVNFC